MHHPVAAEVGLLGRFLVAGAAHASPLWARYGTRLDAESAREVLAGRIERAASEPKPAAPRKRVAKPKAASPADPVTDFLRSRQGKALEREVVRGIFGMLRKRL